MCLIFKINILQTPLIEVTKEELVDYSRLKVGDILLNRVNSSDLVGKAGILDYDIGSAVFDSMIIRIRVNRLCIPHYLNYFLNTKIYFSQIKGKIKHAIGQSSLNQDDLNNLFIGLPPLSEQKQFIFVLSILDENLKLLTTINKNNKNLNCAPFESCATPPKISPKDIV